jgi:hypothetical protein
MRGALAALALGVLAAAYAVSLHLFSGAARPVSAVVVGGGLLVVGELAFGGPWRSPGRLGVCMLGGAAVAVVALLAGAVHLPRSIAITVAGCVAVLAALWLLVSVARGDVGRGDVGRGDITR